MPGDRGQGNQGGTLAAVKAVFWAFMGIRKGAASQADFAFLKLWQVVVAGVIGAILLVTIIVTSVKLIVR